MQNWQALMVTLDHELRETSQDGSGQFQVATQVV